MKEKLLIEKPGSNAGMDPTFMNLKKEYLHLVERCFDDSPLSVIEIIRWLELDSLLSNRIAIITGSRSTPAISA